jgi:hypothetical protein
VKQLIGQADAPPGWERLSLDLPDMIAQSGADSAAAADLLDQVARHVQASVKRCIETPVRLGGRDTNATRLCSATDWESPDWYEVVERCFSGNAIYAQGSRSRWAWERVSLLQNMRSVIDEQVRPWVLVVCSKPDHLPAQVAHYGYRVAYVSYANFLSGLPESAAAWETSLSIHHMINHPDIVPLDVALSRKVGPFSAAIFAGTDVSEGGAERFKAVSARLAEITTEDAFISMAVQVHLNKGSGRALSFREWQAVNQPDGMIAQMGLHPIGAYDSRIPLDCAVRFAPEDQSQYVSGLSFGWGDSMVTLAVVNASRSDAGFAAAPVLNEATEQQNAVDRPASPFPAAVMEAASEAMQQGFACRVVPGLPRDLSKYTVAVPANGSLHWYLLPLQLVSAAPLLVKLPDDVDEVGLVDFLGLVTLPTDGTAGICLQPATPGPSRQVLIFACESDAPAQVIV